MLEILIVLLLNKSLDWGNRLYILLLIWSTLAQLYDLCFCIKTLKLLFLSGVLRQYRYLVSWIKFLMLNLIIILVSAMSVLSFKFVYTVIQILLRLIQLAITIHLDFRLLEVFFFFWIRFIKTIALLKLYRPLVKSFVLLFNLSVKRLNVIL